jgi:hypothetical protein
VTVVNEFFVRLVAEEKRLVRKIFFLSRRRRFFVKVKKKIVMGSWMIVSWITCAIFFCLNLDMSMTCYVLGIFASVKGKKRHSRL